MTKPPSDYEKAVTISLQQQCQGSRNGHRWSVGHDNKTLTCAKCGVRGLDRKPFPFSAYNYGNK
jgi:hypothetical protein